MSSTIVKELDIRPVPPREKHPTIFAKFDLLQKGEILQLINDHDPMPLYYQMQALRSEQFTWEYKESGPEVWIVNITKEKNIMEENDFNFINNLNPDKIIPLDVRPIINAGKDPFLEIMSKVKFLKEDDIFLLINSFEPIPLYSVMGKKGFDYKIIKEEEVFKIYFFKSNDQANSTGENTGNELTSVKIPHDYENIIEIDVRDLTPPEPMVKVLEALSKVDDKTVLVVHHHREPLMLYPKLEERGYSAISNRINDNYFKVIIMKKTDKV